MLVKQLNVSELINFLISADKLKKEKDKVSYCWGTMCYLNSFMHRGIDSTAYSDVGSI